MVDFISTYKEEQGNLICLDKNMLSAYFDISVEIQGSIYGPKDENTLIKNVAENTWIRKYSEKLWQVRKGVQTMSVLR